MLFDAVMARMLDSMARPCAPGLVSSVTLMPATTQKTNTAASTPAPCRGRNKYKDNHHERSLPSGMADSEIEAALRE